jgi:hypothetical protein
MFIRLDSTQGSSPRDSHLYRMVQYRTVLVGMSYVLASLKWAIIASTTYSIAFEFPNVNRTRPGESKYHQPVKVPLECP